MQFLKNENEINFFTEVISQCKSDVYLTDWQDENEPNSIIINLKSPLSLYVGISKLISDKGDWFEIHCYNREDEQLLLEFFDKLKHNNLGTIHKITVHEDNSFKS